LTSNCDILLFIVVSEARNIGSQHRVQSAEARIASATSAQLVLDTLQFNCEARISREDTTDVKSNIANFGRLGEARVVLFRAIPGIPA